MIIQLDNNQRKFLVQSKGFKTIDIFCNLNHIPEVLKTQFEPNDEFVIYEFWNRKFRKCSKKLLNEMFVMNNVDYKL